MINVLKRNCKIFHCRNALQMICNKNAWISRNSLPIRSAVEKNQQFQKGLFIIDLTFLTYGLYSRTDWVLSSWLPTSLGKGYLWIQNLRRPELVQQSAYTASEMWYLTAKTAICHDQCSWIGNQHPDWSWFNLYYSRKIIKYLQEKVVTIMISKLMLSYNQTANFFIHLVY